MNTTTKTNNLMLRNILAEVRQLRNELKLVLPQDELKFYAHPKKIKQNYQKALRQYPPA